MRGDVKSPLARLDSESDLPRVRDEVADALGDDGAVPSDRLPRARCSTDGWPVRVCEPDGPGRMGGGRAVGSSAWNAPLSCSTARVSSADLSVRELDAP